jgi:transcriptional regulator with XRE-family HTH domain
MALAKYKTGGEKKLISRLKLKHKLELLGFGVADVAARAGVSTQAVYDWINGKTADSPDIYSAFSTLLRKKAA